MQSATLITASFAASSDCSLNPNKRRRQSQEETQRRQPVPGGGESQVPSRLAVNSRRIPLHKLPPPPSILWENLKSAILKTSEDVLGHTKKKNKDWFDENNKDIQDLLSKTRAAHQAHLAQPTCHVKKATFRQACSILQRKLRDLQNDWWTVWVWNPSCALTLVIIEVSMRL